MADLRERVLAEAENVDRVLREMRGLDTLAGLSMLELAGVAALLHAFYGGVENILKQLLTARGIPLPAGEAWHRDLLALATERGMIGQATRAAIGEYLAFRHFFSHGYAFDLEPERLTPLVASLAPVHRGFMADVNAALDAADQ